MTYTFKCDGWCNDAQHEGRPALTGEFDQDWFRSTPEAGRVARDYDEDELTTLCGECTEQLLLKT